MAQLAIRGHVTRGKEVIEILEMLGGDNIHYMNASDERSYYYNSTDNVEILSDSIKAKRRNNDVVYTLEEFLDKYPYKVGDKVIYEDKRMKITKMVWEEQTNTVAYKLDDKLYCNVINKLQPYKEETMETITIDDFKANTKEWLIDKLESMSKDNALQAICNIHDELQKSKYPKTYKECCDVLGLNTMDNDAKGYKAYLIIRFQELLIARDAYWKIAGEEMGFGKPWIYNISKEEFSYTISYSYGDIQKNEIRYKNAILIFPTKEMRDAFYENFKDLIEECKEFL